MEEFCETERYRPVRVQHLAADKRGFPDLRSSAFIRG